MFMLLSLLAIHFIIIVELIKIIFNIIGTRTNYSVICTCVDNISKFLGLKPVLVDLSELSTRISSFVTLDNVTFASRQFSFVIIR